MRIYPLGFYDILTDGNTALFSDIFISGLMKMDFATGLVKLIDFLPIGSDDPFFNQYANLSRFNDDIIIAPRNGRYILRYNMKNGSMKKYPIDISHYENVLRHNLFMKSFVYNDSFWCFPGRYPAICELKLNAENASVLYHREWFETVKSFVSDENRVIFNHPVAEENHMILPGWQGDCICDYDMQSLRMDIRRTGSGESLADIRKGEDEGEYWLTFRDIPKISHIVGNKSEEFSIDARKSIIEGGFMYMEPCKNGFILAPKYGDGLWHFDTTNYSWEKICSLPTEYTNKMAMYKLPKITVTYMGSVGENELIMYSPFDGMVYIVNKETGVLRLYEMQLEPDSERMVEEHYYKKFFDNEILPENSFDGLDKFLYGVINYK